MIARVLRKKHTYISPWQHSYGQSSKRIVPQANTRNILITAALPYINNVPHLGNLIGGLLSADVYARFCRMVGHTVLFVSGTDEYGTATEVKARKANVTPQEQCDKYHRIHKQIYQNFEISTDIFSRTSTSEHKRIVQQIFNKLDQNKLIDQADTIQFYCNNCAMSLADRFVDGTCSYCEFTQARADQCDNCSQIFNNPTQQLKNPTCSICKQVPVSKTSRHLFLNLKALESQISQWLYKEDGMKQWTNNSKAISTAWLKQLKNRCISRDLKWGVPIPKPGFQQKVLYVWFDAPIGYISMTYQLLGADYKKWWMPQTNEPKVQLAQFMGKDNTAFHSIMFPAMLIGTGQSYIKPKKLIVTEYLNYQSGKFSKSRGTGVFGDDCKSSGIDVSVWRYYLLANRPENCDSEFSWSDFANKNNRQLLNSIGNLYQRVMKYSFKTFNGRVPKIEQTQLGKQQLQLGKQIERSVKDFIERMEKVQIRQALSLVLGLSHIMNKYLQDSEFWKYSKQSSLQPNQRKDAVVVRVITECLHIYSALLFPFMPGLTYKIRDLLGCDDAVIKLQPNAWNQIISNLSKERHTKQPTALFKPITEDQVQTWRLKFSNNNQARK